jgi:microcystin-dependent protein
MFKKLNINDKKNITILIILFIVLFAILYVWQNKKNVEEGFAQYNVNSGDLISLYGLDNVVVGSNNPITLTSSINNLIDERNSTSLSNTYAKTSDLANTNMNVSSNAASLLSTINTMNALRDKLNTDLNIMNSIITSNVALMNNNLTNSINTMNTNLTSNISNAPPPLTIVAYYGSIPPIGWQLCDGLPLMSMDTPPQQVFYSIGNSVKALNTPNLLGRFILGATTNINANTQIQSSIALRNDVGTTGGEEKVKLSISEIPAHNHNMRNRWVAGGNQGDGLAAGWGGTPQPLDIHTIEGGDPSLPKINHPLFPTIKINDTKPHNNMPPYYALIYIIKKPNRGGASNPVQQPSPSITN